LKYNHRTGECFSALYFHDSPIQKITFSGSEITIELDFAHVLIEHPWNHTDRHICVDSVRLRFLGVTSSKATLNRSVPGDPAEHPDPTNPLNEDLLETSEDLRGDYSEYTLSGGYHSEMIAGWVEWKIVANGFEVSWKSWGSKTWMT
jgi:hypothetical protein